MRVECRDIEPGGKQEEHGANCGEPAIAARLALGRLKQPIEGLQEAVGLARLCPDEDAFHVAADQAGNLLHGLNLGKQPLQLGTALRAQAVVILKQFPAHSL